MADNPALLSLLGMCRKANRLGCGHDAAVEAIRQGRASMCLFSSDSSERLKAEIQREIKMNNREVAVYVLDSTMQEIGHVTGLRSAVLSINDDGFAKSADRLVNTNDGRKTNVK